MGWRIEVHHINVLAGDSALILVNGYDDNDSKTIFSKAVLIDGGSAEYGAAHVLPYLNKKLPRNRECHEYDFINVS